MFYVLNTAGDRSSVLNLDGAATLAEAHRQVRWQAKGGFDPDAYAICAFDEARNQFAEFGKATTWTPGIGPYTVEAWDGFCRRIGYFPDLDEPGAVAWAIRDGLEDAAKRLDAFRASDGECWEDLDVIESYLRAALERLGAVESAPLVAPHAATEAARLLASCSPQAFSFGKEVTDGDSSVIECDGFTLTATIYDDPDHGAPWEEEDGHGPVSGWDFREAREGERVLSYSDGARRFYDVAEALKIAERDGWGPGTPAEAVEADFANLKAWCDDEWRYVGVAVTVAREGVELSRKYEHAIWGIDSTSGEHCAFTAGELVADALDAARAKLSTLTA